MCSAILSVTPDDGLDSGGTQVNNVAEHKNKYQDINSTNKLFKFVACFFFVRCQLCLTDFLCLTVTQ